MKILAPVAKSKDVAPLLKVGVSEFYGGISLSWNKKYHIINSINRRYYESANFQNNNDFINAVRRINDGGGAFFVTLNAPYYIPEQYIFLKKYIQIMVDIGVAGFIVADIILIKYLRETYPETKIHVSTVSACVNIQSIHFLNEFNVNRIVLPRELTTEEIISIRAQTDVELEVFLSPLGCSNIDGYCGYQHIHTPDAPASICCFTASFYDMADKKRWLPDANIQDCRLCQIWDLKKNNIDSIKIIGRGDPVASVLRNVLLLKKMLSLIETQKVLKKIDFHRSVIQDIVPKSVFTCDLEGCPYKE